MKNLLKSDKPIIIVGGQGHMLLTKQLALSHPEVQVLIDDDLVKKEEQRKKDEAALLSVALLTKSMLPTKSPMNLYGDKEGLTTRKSKKQQKARAKNKRAKHARKK